jgi:hypothetical protein
MPHDRFYGFAAAELAEQRPDRDLFARAYAMALGDAEKTKAIYIGIRAERLEEEAIDAAHREAAIEKTRVQQERERAKRKAADAPKRSLPEKVEACPPLLPTTFTDPEIARAVQAMREALAASAFRKG